MKPTNNKLQCQQKGIELQVIQLKVSPMSSAKSLEHGSSPKLIFI